MGYIFLLLIPSALLNGAEPQALGQSEKTELPNIKDFLALYDKLSMSDEEDVPMTQPHNEPYIVHNNPSKRYGTLFIGSSRQRYKPFHSSYFGRNSPKDKRFGTSFIGEEQPEDYSHTLFTGKMTGKDKRFGTLFMGREKPKNKRFGTLSMGGKVKGPEDKRFGTLFIGQDRPKNKRFGTLFMGTKFPKDKRFGTLFMGGKVKGPDDKRFGTLLIGLERQNNKPFINLFTGTKFTKDKRFGTLFLGGKTYDDNMNSDQKEKEANSFYMNDKHILSNGVLDGTGDMVTLHKRYGTLFISPGKRANLPRSEMDFNSNDMGNKYNYD